MAAAAPPSKSAHDMCVRGTALSQPYGEHRPDELSQVGDRSARRHDGSRAVVGGGGVLEAWKRSGRPLEVFAKERGLVAQRLRWWRKKLNRQERVRTAGPVPALLPLRVAQEPLRRGEPVTVLLRTGHML